MRKPLPPKYAAEEIYGIIPKDTRQPFDVREIIARLVDNSDFDEFKPLYGATLVCGFAHWWGYPVKRLEHQKFDPRLTERSFAIGLRDVFEAIALPALIQRLQDAAPSLEIASIRTDRRDIEAELTAGTLDLALDVPLAVSNNIRQQRIFQDV